MQNAFLQSALDDVGVQGRAGLMEEEGQPIPPLQAVRDRLSQTRVGLHFLFCELGEETGDLSKFFGSAVIGVSRQR